MYSADRNSEVSIVASMVSYQWPSVFYRCARLTDTRWNPTSFRRHVNSGSDRQLSRLDVLGSAQLTDTTYRSDRSM